MSSVRGSSSENVVPSAGRAVDRDRAAALPDEAVDHRQSEAGAGAFRLGGEERLEDPRPARRAECRRRCRARAARRTGRRRSRAPAPPSALMSRFEVSIASRPPCGMASRALSTRLTSTCSSCAASARTDHRSDASRRSIAMCSPIRRSSMRLMSDDALVEHDDLGRQDLPAAEGEQLSGQRRGAIGGVEDLLDVGVQRRALQGLHQQLRVAANRGEQVVEVVRDAARQPADRLHLLRVTQLFLELAARRFGGLPFGHFAAQLLVGAAERGGALVDAAFEIAMRLVQRQLARAQLALGVVPLGHVAQDHQHLRFAERAAGALRRIAAPPRRHWLRARC